MQSETGYRLSLPVSAPLLSDSGFQRGHIFLTYSKRTKGVCCTALGTSQSSAAAAGTVPALGIFSPRSRQRPDVSVALQDRVVRAPGPGMAVQDPACRGSHLADRQWRGSETSPCHCQSGQRSQCKYLSCRNPSYSCLSGREGAASRDLFYL